MSTQTGPDLTYARGRVELLMDDTCELRRDTGSTGDDDFDDDTGVITPWSDDASLIYSGPCKFAPLQQLRPVVVTEGSRPYVETYYRLGMPLDSPLPAVEDILVCTSSRRDPALVGTVFVVRDVLVSTFAISRRAVVERRE